MLQPDKLKKLNENALKMAEAGKSKEEILAMKDAFISQFGANEPEKKNPVGSSPSTTPKENTDLAPTTGSSVLKSTNPFPETNVNSPIPNFNKMKTDVGPTSREEILKKKLANVKVTSENMDQVSADTDELSALQKAKHQKQYQNDEKIIQKLNATDDNRTETDLADEKNDNQVTDYLREGAKNVGNVIGGIVNIVPKTINALSGNNLAIPSIDKFEKKVPLEKQLKQVQKEDPDNKLTPDEQQQRAEELFRNDSKKEQVKENFNNALTPGVLGVFASDFEEKKALQERLKAHEINKIPNLTRDQKVNSAQIQLFGVQGLALKKDIESDLAIVKSGKADQELIQNLAIKQDKYKEVEDKYLALLDEQAKIKNTQLSVQDNIDHFKLDYDPIVKALDDTIGAFENPIGGALNLMGKASDALRKIPGATSIDVADGEKSALSVLGEKLIVDAENRSKSHRAIELDNIHSASDFGSYVTQVFTTASPYLLGGIQYQAGKTILGSAAGTGFFMAGSGGKKAYDMDQEIKNDPFVDYNNLQYVSAIAGYMAAEKLMLGGYDRIMKGAGATIESISKNPIERELFEQGIKTHFSKIIDNTGKFISATNKSGMIGLTTGVTRMATDNIALGKKSEDPFKEMIDGYVNMAAMHLVMSGPPQLIKTGAYALSKVSEGKSKKKVAENYLKIEKLNEQLKNPDLTDNDRNILNSAISLLHQENRKTISKSLEKLGSFTRPQINELLKVDQEKLAIRKQVEGLKSMDSGVSTDAKPELLKALKAKFDAIEDRKMDVFNNENNSLELLPAGERNKLLADAKKELYNTSKTDEKGNEVEITEKDIKDKATSIHLEQERFNGMDIKEIEVLKKTALRQLNTELTTEQKEKGITISNYEITKRAIENHNKTIVNETETATTPEAQPQAEVQKPSEAEKVETPPVEKAANPVLSLKEKQIQNEDNRNAELKEVANVINKEDKKILEDAINKRYDEQYDNLKADEAIQESNTPTDGNVRSGDKPNNAQGKNNELQPAVDAKPSEGEAKVNAKEQDEFDNLLSGEAEKRRKEGKYSRDGVEFVRQEKSTGPVGKKDTVKFADKEEVPFEYTLMEAKDVQPSHLNGKRNPDFFITEAQPKNRKDDASKKASDEIGRNPKLKETGENSNAYSGAPVVNERGEVIQGNNRAEGLKKHYSNNGKDYKEQLKADAEKYGFTPEQVDGMENPILVRKVAVNDAKAIELGNRDVKDLETGGTRRLDPVTTSRRIPKIVKAKIIDALFRDNSDITLNKAVRENQGALLGLLKDYMNEAQMESIVRKDGTMRPNGVEDLEKLVQHFLFDGGNVNMPEHFESLSGMAREGVLKSLPKLLSIESAKSIIPELQNAIGAFHAFKQSGVEDFKAWLNQADMFDGGKTPAEKYSPLEIEIADILHNSKNQKEIKTIFDKYADKTNDFQGDMFEPARKGSDKKEAVKEIFKVENYEDKRNDGSPKQETPMAERGKEGSDGGNDGKPAGNPAGKKNGGGIDLKSTPDQILEWLDQQEKNLDNFGKENLSVGIPIVLAKGAIQAMRVAVKAGKLAAEVIQAGLDHVKQSDWYKNLTQKEKDEIDNDFQGNFLNKINAIDPSNEKQAENLLNRAVSESISEDYAYDEVKTTFEKARTELANKKLPAEYVRDAYRNFIKRFSDRQYLAKMLLNKSGMKAVQNLIINSHGTSGKARIQFQEAYDKIYKKLTTEERKILDEVIQAKRFIAIDTNREARGLDPVSHPNFIDKNKSEKFLSKLEKELGTEKYNDLVERANAYFDTYKGLLKDMLDNGLISQASFDSMSDVDYQPRVFLQYITDFNGDMETNKRTNNLDTGGLSSDQIKAMSEGDANSLVLNSEWLLANSLLARSKAMAMNNINKRFMTDEYQKAKARFDALDPKNLKGDDARFYKYFKELSSKVIDNPIIGQTESGNNKYKYDKTPLNYAKMYYYIDGQQHQFFLEKDLHESWNDNIGGFLSSDAKEFLSYASGSALVKAIATGNNPAFPIVNTPRDFMFNIAFSDQYSKLVPKAMFQVAKDVASSVKEIAKKDSEVLKKYIEYGGAMDFLSSQGRLKKESVIGKILEKNISANTRDTSKKIFDAVTLHKISAYSEMMFRLGVFQRTIKNQVKELGLQDISEVTDKQQRDDIYNQAVANARSMMDFNQGGSITKDLESVIPYINAATQGGRVAISSFEKDPIGTTARLLQIATIASTVPIGISLALISAMKSDDDEDKTASEIYLHAMSGISKYQKSKYMNIVTGVKDDEGEYQVLKIAKSQELSPVISVTDDIYANLLRKIAGKEKKSAGSITQDALFTLNSNVMPIDVTSPAGLITRTPMVKAALTYQTGYDFFRDEPLSMDIGKVPLAVEGINQSSTEDFYKKLGPNFGLSPIRSKAFVESLITGPSTNPFVGMLYGGADAATSDKDMKKIGAELFNTIYKSTGKRVVSYSTDFNRKLSGQQELQKEIDAINIEKHLNKAKFKELGNQFLNKEITQKELNTELEKLDPYERQMALSRIKDLRQLKGVSGTVLDIKYEREAKAKALMIMHYYGDIFDGRKENSEVKKEMMRAKGIITPKVMFEYNKLKEELNKKTPN